MNRRDFWPSMITIFLLSLLAVSLASAQISEDKAIKVLMVWINAHVYYDLPAECISPKSLGYKNGGYTIELRAERCPGYPQDTFLGRWRVDALTGEVYVQNEGGKYLSPTLKKKKAAVPAGYRIYKAVRLEVQVHGLDGALQLLQDERVVAQYRNTLWGFDDAMWCDQPDATLKNFCASIQRKPLLPAIVRLVNPNGEVLDSRTMERVLVSISAHALYGSKKPTYFITVDYSAGWGSYSGPIEFLVEVGPGKLQWLKALDQRDGKEAEITLMDSLKTAWRLIPRDDGKGQDIVKLACRPNFSKLTDGSTDDQFELIYTRFHFDGHRWLMLERREPGFWENEDWVPNRAQFP